MADARVTDEMVDRALGTWIGGTSPWFQNSEWKTMPDAAKWRGNMRLAIEAALSPSPPAPGGVPIRIAVAFDSDGNHDAYRIRAEESFAWEVLNRRGYELRAAIITATVAPPVVAEIAGIVQPAGGE